MALKLLWLAPQVTFRGKGIITAWGEEMTRGGWELVQEPPCDLAFFGSDSMLSEGLIEKYPTIAYFWGWLPGRLLDAQFRQFAEARLGVMARSTRILVPSPTVQDQCFNFGLPAFICEPGVDTTIQCPGDAPIEQRAVFISRLAPHKNLHLLMQAISLMEHRVPLLVIGPGDSEPYRQLASQLGVRVDFQEPDDAQKIFELRRSAVLVHPSQYEGFGLPPLEALYNGVPVVALDTPHMRWLLQEDAFYFSSLQGLAGLLDYAIFRHPREALDRASRGKRRVENYYTLPHACDRLWAHIHQTIKEHLAQQLREKPGEWARIYDAEHRRNYAYSIDRFDPTWERHWRATTFINLLKECGAKKILDVGCGAVYPTIFARAGFEVTALDISEECLNQACLVAEKWGVRHKMEPLLGDAMNLGEIPDGWFDAVVQGEIWEHIADPRKVIEEGLRVLKPGGYLIATTPIGHSHWDPMHFGPVEGGWDDATLKELLMPWEGMVKRLEKIAEEGTEPSCFLVVMVKEGR